ncbi:hypothetical protein [Escherichia coli]|nr:hypothetical protein [Escherichia coli]
MEKRLLLAPVLCFAHMFFPALSLILWITVLPPLSELTRSPQRPSVASQ